MNSCTCSKKTPPQSQKEEDVQDRPVEFAPRDYQALKNDPKKAPDYTGIQVPNVVIKDLKDGKGELIKSKTTVKIRFQMWVYDPKKIGNKGLPIVSPAIDQVIEIGKGQVIKGFEEGLLGMRQGGRRQLIIPSELAYGKKGVPNVPPNAILLVEAEAIPNN